MLYERRRRKIDKETRNVNRKGKTSDRNTGVEQLPLAMFIKNLPKMKNAERLQCHETIFGLYRLELLHKYDQIVENLL